MTATAATVTTSLDVDEARICPSRLGRPPNRALVLMPTYFGYPRDSSPISAVWKKSLSRRHLSHVRPMQWRIGLVIATMAIALGGQALAVILVAPHEARNPPRARQLPRPLR